MKKIGIITQHRVVNYGSVLQTYALQQKIIELGYDCDIIDYYPERFTPIGMLKRIKNKGTIYHNPIIRLVAQMIIIPSYIIRFRMFFDFLSANVKMTHKTYKTYEDLLSEDFRYDVFCTGSDQVWNYGWNERIEYPYFLGFVPEDKRKISYAASFGKSKLDDFEIEETRKLLLKYDAISLREQTGVEIVNGLGIINATNVVDPTLLLNGAEWRKIASSAGKKESYILIYNLNRNKKIDQYAQNLSKKTGLKIKYLSYQLHEFYKKGKMYCNPKVEDFLALIDNAEYVITDSFHATAFSLNLNTQFVIVYPKKYSTRLQSILKITGLLDRVAEDENDMSVVDNVIDYERVNKILKNQRDTSFEWLKNAIED